MTSKKPAASKRANLPRASDYTREFLKDWQRLSRPGRHDMNRLKEVMMLIIANDGPLPPEWMDHALAEILSKPSRLNKIEFELIKMHPQTGYDILKGIDFPWPIAQMVYQHHERMDGSGYPRGLKGDEILLEARIICVADVVEAMASHRPYRPGLGVETALAEIERNRGALYDPAVVDACLRLFREKNYKLET